MVMRRNFYPNVFLLSPRAIWWGLGVNGVSTYRMFTVPFIASVTTNSAHSYSYFYLIPVQN